MLQDDKAEWIVIEGKEYLIIPKEMIEQITDKVQGVKVIETKPVWKWGASMFKFIRKSTETALSLLQYIADDLRKARVDIQLANDKLKGIVEELKKLQQENILPSDKEETQSVIDNAFRLKNGLYSFKKVLHKDGE